MKNNGKCNYDITHIIHIFSPFAKVVDEDSSSCSLPGSRKEFVAATTIVIKPTPPNPQWCRILTNIVPNVPRMRNEGTWITFKKKGDETS